MGLNPGASKHINRARGGCLMEIANPYTWEHLLKACRPSRLLASAATIAKCGLNADPLPAPLAAPIIFPAVRKRCSEYNHFLHIAILLRGRWHGSLEENVLYGGFISSPNLSCVSLSRECRLRPLAYSSHITAIGFLKDLGKLVKSWFFAIRRC